MRYRSLENLIWCAALAAEIAFAVIAIVKGRWRSFPALTAFVLLEAVASAALVSIRYAKPELYPDGYLAYSALDFVLQLAVIFEIARNVLAGAPGLLRGAWKQFLVLGLLGVALALAFAIMVAPPSKNLLELVEIRADLFSSLFTCELVIVMMMTSASMGLGWRNHVMAVGEGLLLWYTTGVVVDSLHSYYGFSRFFAVSEYSENVVYVGVLVYWCIQLWKEEPARREISPELRKYMVALHERVHYDLGEMER
jgi:hypothetical protein